MSKLPLIPNPTFKAKVKVSLPGNETAEIQFTFKHRNRNQLQEWAGKERNDVDAILEVASDWDLLEPFNAESVELLVQNYISSPEAVVKTYLAELTGTKE